MTRSFPRRRFALPDGRWLSVVEAGDPSRPTLLLLHGAAGSISNWSFQLGPMAEHFRIVAPDLRGHGATPWPGPSHLQDFYADVEALLLSLERPVAVVGHSFGGCLATMLAARHPDRVAGLGLINTGGHLPQGPVYQVLRLFCGWADWFRGHYPWIINTTSHVFQWLFRCALPEWDCWSLYPGLSMPVLVLLGGLDALIPVRFGPRLASLIPDCRLRIVPWAGHVLMAERPALVNEELEQLMVRLFRA